MEITWILDFDYDFDAPQRIAPLVKRHVVLPENSLLLGDNLKVEYPCVAYGTMRKLAQLGRGRVCEAVFDDYLSLRCSSYYRYIYRFLRREVFLIPFCGLLCVEWKRVLGERVFIRPDGNHKPFEAEIVVVDELDDFVRRYGGRQNNELVVVSEVVKLGQEYRCFCRDGRVFCHSSYPDPPYCDAPFEVITFAEKVAGELLKLGLSMVTVDVALGDCLRVVEIGGVNSWGIYGGDIEAFIKIMELEAVTRQVF